MLLFLIAVDKQLASMRQCGHGGMIMAVEGDLWMAAAALEIAGMGWRKGEASLRRAAVALGRDPEEWVATVRADEVRRIMERHRAGVVKEVPGG